MLKLILFGLVWFPKVTATFDLLYEWHLWSSSFPPSFAAGFLRVCDIFILKVSEDRTLLWGSILLRQKHTVIINYIITNKYESWLKLGKTDAWLQTWQDLHLSIIRLINGNAVLLCCCLYYYCPHKFSSVSAKRRKKIRIRGGKNYNMHFKFNSGDR